MPLRHFNRIVEPIAVAFAGIHVSAEIAAHAGAIIQHALAPHIGKDRIRDIHVAAVAKDHHRCAGIIAAAGIVLYVVESHVVDQAAAVIPYGLES